MQGRVARMPALVQQRFRGFLARANLREVAILTRGMCFSEMSAQAALTGVNV